MTIPITPGPFSFLASAGQAAGSIGEALLAKKTRLNEEARRRLSDILALVNAGTAPTPEMEAEARAAAEHLKLTSPIPTTPDPEGLIPSSEAFNRASALPWFQQPTPPSLLGGPAERARIALDLARSQAKSAEGTARRDVVSGNVAERTEGSQVTAADAAARQAMATAEGTESDLAVRRRINELITTELKNPETNFGKLAARAAAGLTPYYTAMAQIRFGQNSLERERMKQIHDLLMVPFENARFVLKSREDAWEMARRDQEFQHPDDKEYMKDWEKLHPKPALGAIQQELLEEAARNRGLSVEEYNNLLNESVGIIARLEQEDMPAPKVSLLQRRVTEVLSGKLTVEQVEQEINQGYRERGNGPMDALKADFDILQFKRMLQEAQDSAKSTRR